MSGPRISFGPKPGRKPTTKPQGRQSIRAAPRQGVPTRPPHSKLLEKLKNRPEPDIIKVCEPDEPFRGYDQDEFDTDPFLIPEFGLGSFLTPVWVWKGRRMLWCRYRPDSLDRRYYSKRLEMTRSLLENLTRGFADSGSFPFLNQRDPRCLKGFLNSSWLKDGQGRIRNPKDYFRGKALLLPGEDEPVFPLPVFIGGPGGRGKPPAWFGRLWLEYRLEKHDAGEAFAVARRIVRRNTEGGFGWLPGEWRILLRNLNKVITKAIKDSGYLYPGPEVYRTDFKMDDFWNRLVRVEWRPWWKREYFKPNNGEH